MIIREARDTDILEILRVLKASLGEISSKKTEEAWRFKHIDNPFGHSLVLLAEENGKIIGVRAFMRWQWQRGEDLFSAFRAVDTATHPDHQGKGIFKKLTLTAVETGVLQNDHFVFNTPNEQSLPGYLKMGWQEVSRVNVTLMPTNPLNWLSKTGIPKYYNDFKKVKLEKLLTDYNNKISESGKLFTPKSSEFLEWRYLNNPLQSYYVWGNEKIFLAAYLKKHNFLKELRIVEMIYFSDSEKGEVKRRVNSWAKDLGAQFVSYHSPQGEPLSSLQIEGAYGPVLTFRKLNILDESLLNINSWEYSLGDLELF